MSPDHVLDFLLTCGALKTTKRTGWVQSRVHQPESISDHMHRMGLISLIMQSNCGIDINKCVQMSLVHDLAEAIVGDLTPDCGVSKEKKHVMEEQALQQMLTGLDGATQDRISQLWNEYEQGETSEAVLVKDIDKFEMLIQAYEYERDQGLDLSRFYESTLCRLSTPIVKDLAECLLIRRQSLKLTSSQPSSSS